MTAAVHDVRQVPARCFRRSDRIDVLLLGGAMLLLGVFWQLDRATAGELFLPRLWGPWFVSTGLATCAYAIRPHSDLLYSWCGAAIVCAMVGRAVALTLAILDDRVGVRTWRTAAGVVLWLLAARLARRVWRAFTPVPT